MIYSIVYSVIFLLRLFLFLLLLLVILAYLSYENVIFLSVECNKQLVGYGILNCFREVRKTSIQSLFVAPAWRRRGLGSAFINFSQVFFHFISQP
jgi:GNAT superfamily N-acetyltransferase